MLSISYALAACYRNALSGSLSWQGGPLSEVRACQRGGAGVVSVTPDMRQLVEYELEVYAGGWTSGGRS